MEFKLDYVGIICREPYGKQGMILEQSGDYAKMMVGSEEHWINLSDLSPQWEATLTEMQSWWDKPAAALKAEEVLCKLLRQYGQNRVVDAYKKVRMATPV